MAFDKIKRTMGIGRIGQVPEAVDQVASALLPLRAISQSLYDRCVLYVVDGSSPELLMELASSPDPLRDGVLCAPGQLRNYYVLPDPALHALAKAGVLNGGRQGHDNLADRVRAMRDPLYRSEDLTSAQWVRWGRLMGEIGLGPNRVADGAPAWAVALVNDVVGTCPRDSRSPEGLATHRPLWTAHAIAQLVRDSGVDETTIPATVFLVVFQDDGSGWSYYSAPTDLPGLGDYLIEHGSGIPVDVVPRVSAAGRVRLAEMAVAVPDVARATAGLLAVLCTDSSKTTRHAAVTALRNLEITTLREVLPSVLTKAPTARFGEIAEFLVGAEGGLDILDKVAKGNPRLASAIGDIAQRRQLLAQSPDTEGVLDVPPFSPLPEVSAAAAKVELRRALDKAIERGRGAEHAWLKEAARDAAAVNDADLEAVVAVAEGRDAPAADSFLNSFGLWWIGANAPSLTLVHLLRLEKRNPRHSVQWTLRSRADAETDPRIIEDAMTRSGWASQAGVETADWVWQTADPEAAWPWAAHHLDSVGTQLATVETATKALDVLSHFPRLPNEVLPSVASIAVGDSRVNQPLAQQVLRKHPAARQLAEQALTNSRGEIRAAAAAWLAVLDDPQAVPALRQALTKEKREVVRAGLLGALETLGDDIDAELSPAALLAEATKGLRAKPPASMAWVDARLLPTVHWRDGTLVDAQIVWWWVVLAVKLKNPSGAGLIDLYLSRLQPDDAAILGSVVARAWVAQDSRHPTDEESRAYAATQGPAAYQDAQNWLAQVKRTPAWAGSLAFAEEMAAIPLESRIAAAYAQHQASYLGSAIADKGILALTMRMPGIELASLVQTYLRDNPGRRSQAEALVQALAANGQPAALQLLLSVARRHKMASLQTAALALVEDIAAARGWTPDELADRTVPAAGFAGDRLLHLDFGPREFLGRLTSRGTIDLTTADGIPVKGLPDARASDDADLVAAAKKQLTESRKEVKSVLSLQTGRLYEAMCAARIWPAEDWAEFLAGHPLVSQLVSRLVWVENPGPAQRCFRPSEDGALLDLSDNTIELAEGTRVGIAHRVLLSAEEAAAWQGHLSDYRVTPLFDQFTATVPEFSQDALAIDSLKGHVTDTFTFRGVAGKRGYVRGPAEDGGWFLEYRKPFSGSGLVAVVSFTGSMLPEENIACATESLSFVRGARGIPLGEVPPILLAECYADYVALAALGPYDPDYEKHTGL